MIDAWEEGTYAGKERAQRRRVARKSPQERLEWLEHALLDAERTGVLAEARQRKQHDQLQAWEGAASGT